MKSRIAGLFFALSLVTCHSPLAFAQQPARLPLIWTQEVDWQAQPLAPVTSLGANIVGNAGNSTFYYWIVATYPAGNAAPSPAVKIQHAPDVLSASNYVKVTWSPVAGATSYDVLRTVTPTLPNAAASIAVTTGTSSTSVNDQGAALSSYTVNTYTPGSYPAYLDPTGATGLAPNFSASSYNNVIRADTQPGKNGGEQLAACISTAILSSLISSKSVWICDAHGFTSAITSSTNWLSGIGSGQAVTVLLPAQTINQSTSLILPSGASIIARGVEGEQCCGTNGSVISWTGSSGGTMLDTSGGTGKLFDVQLNGKNLAGIGWIGGGGAASGTPQATNVSITAVNQSPGIGFQCGEIAATACQETIFYNFQATYNVIGMQGAFQNMLLVGGDIQSNTYGINLEGNSIFHQFGGHFSGNSYDIELKGTVSPPLSGDSVFATFDSVFFENSTNGILYTPSAVDLTPGLLSFKHCHMSTNLAAGGGAYLLNTANVTGTVNFDANEITDTQGGGATTTINLVSTLTPTSVIQGNVGATWVGTWPAQPIPTEQFLGADACAKIDAAVQAAGGTGIIDAREFTGSQNCASNMFAHQTGPLEIRFGLLQLHVTVTQAPLYTATLVGVNKGEGSPTTSWTRWLWDGTVGGTLFDASAEEGHVVKQIAFDGYNGLHQAATTVKFGSASATRFNNSMYNVYIAGGTTASLDTGSYIGSGLSAAGFYDVLINGSGAGGAGVIGRCQQCNFYNLTVEGSAIGAKIDGNSKEQFYGGVFTHNGYDLEFADDSAGAEFFGTWFEASTNGILYLPNSVTMLSPLSFYNCAISTSKVGGNLLDTTNLTGVVNFLGNWISGPGGTTTTINIASTVNVLSERFGNTGETWAGTTAWPTGSLPTASASNKGQCAPVSDSDTTTWGATVVHTVGTSYVLACSNGTNWTVSAK